MLLEGLRRLALLPLREATQELLGSYDSQNECLPYVKLRGRRYS